MPDDSFDYEDFATQWGGYWGSGHPDYPLEDWRDLVMSDDTRLGYWEWVHDQVIQ